MPIYWHNCDSLEIISASQINLTSQNEDIPQKCKNRYFKPVQINRVIMRVVAIEELLIWGI